MLLQLSPSLVRYVAPLVTVKSCSYTHKWRHICWFWEMIFVLPNRSLPSSVWQNSIQKGNEVVSLYVLLNHNHDSYQLHALYRLTVDAFLKSLCAYPGIDCYDLMTEITGLCLCLIIWFLIKHHILLDTFFLEVNQGLILLLIPLSMVNVSFKELIIVII